MGGNCKKRDVVPPTCRAVCDNQTELEYEASITFGQKPYALVAIESDIQKEIITNGPVQASFDVYEDFMNYNKGKIDWFYMYSSLLVHLWFLFFSFCYSTKNLNKLFYTSNTLNFNFNKIDLFKLKL